MRSEGPMWASAPTGRRGGFRNHLGQRLGQGGGYYDRFLSNYRGGTVLLCREKLIREEIPLEPHDYPIPWVLTEVGLYEDGTPARLG